MAKPADTPATATIAEEVTRSNYLFRGMDQMELSELLNSEGVARQKLYSSRPVYTAFRPETSTDVLYVVMSGGPVIVRSTPLDRIVALTYPGSCFGMRNLALAYGRVSRSFPSLVEAYKTTNAIEIPVGIAKTLYTENEVFRQRYDYLFELREKFQYHLLNCSTYPPQAVATLLRALIYQERSLGNQPQADGLYVFDLPVDIIAHSAQLNHRTVEQVLKGMRRQGLILPPQDDDPSTDTLRVADAEGLKEVYSATRDKVGWWPLK
jgi:hypothetical protein